MQVWNVLRAARWKCRTQKSPSDHHRINLSGYIFAIKALIDNRKKHLNSNVSLHMFSQYGELRPTSGWDLLASLGHPCKCQRVSRLGSVTARHSGSGRQPNFAALNRGRHLYSTGRPSHWALAHISSYSCIVKNKNYKLLWSFLRRCIHNSCIGLHWRKDCCDSSVYSGGWFQRRVMRFVLWCRQRHCNIISPYLCLYFYGWGAYIAAVTVTNNLLIEKHQFCGLRIHQLTITRHRCTFNCAAVA